MYHRIVEHPVEDPDQLCTTAARLRGHLTWMLDHGFAPVPLDVVVQPPRSSEGRRFAVTFDDAYIETFELALPILESLSIPSTVFALSGELGGRSRWNRSPADRWPLMTAAQLRSFREAGHFVGSHGQTHQPLTQLDSTRVREEVSCSRARLEDVLGEAVRFFAYPHHDLDSRVEAAVADAGYQGAVGGRAGSHRRFNLHRVPAEVLSERGLLLHAVGIHRRVRRLPLPGRLRALARRFA